MIKTSADSAPLREPSLSPLGERSETGSPELVEGLPSRSGEGLCGDFTRSLPLSTSPNRFAKATAPGLLVSPLKWREQALLQCRISFERIATGRNAAKRRGHAL
jgi:hypothetical protein